MMVAQKLYEAGKISYMRTDSVNLSDEAVQGAVRQIQSAYGKEFIFTRKFKTKSASAQEAHEAIRPTDFSVMDPGMDRNAQRLYELIWKRFTACQMEAAVFDQTSIDIAIHGLALREIGAVWRERIGPHYPAMAVVEVKGLVEDAARVEIETTAVVSPA